MVLERVRKAQKRDPKELINNALRQGLNAIMMSLRFVKPHKTREVFLGRCLLGTLDKVSEALVITEGEDFR